MTKETKLTALLARAEAAIEDDQIVIRVSIAAIPDAVRAGVDLLAIDPPFKVTDPVLFAPELIRALNDEDEEGTTPIHRLFDAAAIAAFEQGAEGAEEVEEDADDEGAES